MHLSEPQANRTVGKAAMCDILGDVKSGRASRLRTRSDGSFDGVVASAKSLNALKS